MAANDSKFINMVIALTLITIISAVMLGFVHKVTEEPIRQAGIERQQKAISDVMTGFSNDPLTDGVKVFNGTDSLEVFPGKKEDETIGYAIKAKSSKGYSGDVWIMVGFDRDGTITETAVIEHKETPGLGTKMADPKFNGQYVGVNPGSVNLQVTKDGGTIDAISGATISSRAFSDAIMQAYETFKTVEDGN